MKKKLPSYLRKKLDDIEFYKTALQTLTPSSAAYQSALKRLFELTKDKKWLAYGREK